MVFDGSLLRISHARAGAISWGISERGVPSVHDSHQIHRIWKRPQQEQGFDDVKKARLIVQGIDWTSSLDVPKEAR